MKIHVMFPVEKCSSINYDVLLVKCGKHLMELYALEQNIGFQQWLTHLPSSWLEHQATFSQHKAKQRFQIEILKTISMWKIHAIRTPPVFTFEALKAAVSCYITPRIISNAKSSLLPVPQIIVGLPLKLTSG